MGQVILTIVTISLCAFLAYKLYFEKGRQN
ncbi:Uncharacterised protein [Helicobacter muridarum]|uniref:Uncharacterized protein n=1 Tax=Helicobacter muridarum TaxID=216 RepID=A0A377PX76_9HELI|nr:Uncharacterised protein [Helicobacter muridarum]